MQCNTIPTIRWWCKCKKKNCFRGCANFHHQRHHMEFFKSDGEVIKDKKLFYHLLLDWYSIPENILYLCMKQLNLAKLQVQPYIYLIWLAFICQYFKNWLLHVALLALIICKDPVFDLLSPYLRNGITL